MTNNGDTNTYEEARKQRLEENMKRFEVRVLAPKSFCFPTRHVLGFLSFKKKNK